jgi:hypothetical protein
VIQPGQRVRFLGGDIDIDIGLSYIGMLLDLILLSKIETRHVKHVINTSSVNHINSIWQYFYAKITVGITIVHLDGLLFSGFVRLFNRF